MRLLYTTSDGHFRFTKDIIRVEDLPPYAILSHTWGDEEVVFDDVKSLTSSLNLEVVDAAAATRGDGWKKLRFCAKQAKSDGLEHFWVDTCCIDKANNTELSEAINSMFRWYQKADKCYAFLADVEGKASKEDWRPSATWKAAFRTSRWFTRGWTLQELLAPHSVEFFSKDGVRLGDKDSLKYTIHEVTAIPIEALSGTDMSKFEVAERLSWARDRQTTREEDKAYCLLGILDCYLPLIYGEGKESALRRLRRNIRERSPNVADASMDDSETDERGRETRLRNIRKWVSAPDPSTNYHKAHKQRQAGTGLWILENAKFKKWKEAKASRMWLYGIPGCGKTILSSTIIEHLLQHCDEDAREVTVYFYFDFKDVQKQDPESMLHALLSQLLQCSVAIPKDVDELFSSCGNGQQQPSLPALLNVAPQLIRQFTHVYIVLDALDECTKRTELTDILETLIGWQLDIVHLLMTSRRERDIETFLGNHVTREGIISLQKDVVDKDILRYVQQRLVDDQDLAKWNKDQDTMQEIEIALMHGARGMFRWAVCQLDTLAKCRNLAMLRQALAALPQTLDETYDRILASIREVDRVYAIRIFQWLTFSTRPLSIEEVAEVAAIDVAREPMIDRDEVLVDPLEALEICSSLVTLSTKEVKWLSRPSQRIITLAHYSVQEYLVSDRIKHGPAKHFSMQEKECHEAIAKGCLGYLSQYQYPITQHLLENHMLARYSAEFWHRHLQKIGDKTEEVNRLAMSLFSTKTAGFLTWIRLYNPDYLQSSPNLSKKLDSIASPLYYGSLLGLDTIVTLLLEQNARVNARGGSYGTALQAASANGHTSVVKLLIDAGADVNATGGEYRSILRAALGRAHEDTTRTLLERGAYVGLDKQLKGALHHAVSNPGCTASMAEMLQQHGAPLDTTDVDNMTPLHYCVKFGHRAIATQLLNAGVPIDIRVRRRAWPHRVGKLDPVTTQAITPDSSTSPRGLTPLHFAALIGDATMVGFLLEHGADSNALSEYDETPLHLTLRTTLSGTTYADDWTNGSLRVEDRLAMQSPESRSLTQDVSGVALARGNVIDALLASPNISLTVRDCEGDTPLHCIRYNEPESAASIRKLISRGADLSCRNSCQQTPLHLASKAGDLVSVKALLSMGAKVTLHDMHGLNAFHYAAQSPNRDTMIAILDTEEARAVNLITSRDAYGQNVLHHTFFDRDRIQGEKIRWLLDQGADGAQLDDSGMSPIGSYITQSSWEIDLDILRSALAFHYIASSLDQQGGTLGHLLAASSNFRLDILAVLHTHHVSLAARDYNGRTIIHYAATHGRLTKDTAHFLINVAGIHPEWEDNLGRTAWEYASKAGVEERKKERERGEKSDNESDNHSDTDSVADVSLRWEQSAAILLGYHSTTMNDSVMSTVLAIHPPELLDDSSMKITETTNSSLFFGASSEILENR